MTNSVSCFVGNTAKMHTLAKSHKSTNAIVIWCSLETILKMVLERHAQDKRHVVVPSIDTIGADDWGIILHSCQSIDFVAETRMFLVPQL